MRVERTYYGYKGPAESRFRTRPLDCNDGAAPEPLPRKDTKLRNEPCRQLGLTLISVWPRVTGELLRESRCYRQSRCTSELALAFGTLPVAVKRSDP